MNIEDLFNAQNTAGMSPEKLAFLKLMAAQQTGNNAQELMAALMSANQKAAQQGISFTESERNLLLEALVQNLPPADAAKAKRMIQLLQRMRH